MANRQQWIQHPRPVLRRGCSTLTLTLFAMAATVIAITAAKAMPAAPASQSTANASANIRCLSTSDNLASEIVFAIARDRDGYFWAATANGLDRHDGYDFVNFPREADISGGRELHAVFADRQDRIWGGGTQLHLYDKRSQTYRIFDVSDGRFINTIFEDSKGQLWIGGHGFGLRQIDPASGHVMRVLPDGQKRDTVQTTLRNTLIRAINEDAQGNLWLATDDGIFHLRSNSTAPELIRPSEQLAGLDSDGVRQILFDRVGLLWATSPNGLLRYDLAHNAWNRFQHGADPGALVTNDLWSLHEDRRGRLWIGTDKQGLELWSPQTQQFIHYRSGDLSYQLPRAAIFDIDEDNSGALWLGGYTLGLCRFSIDERYFQLLTPNPHAPELGPSFGNLLALHEDSQGNIWIATDGGGLNRFDPRSGRFKHYHARPDESGALGSDSVISIAADAQGILWLGTWQGGFYRFDPASERFTRYDTRTTRRRSGEGLLGDSIFSIHVDAGGMLWLSVWDHGLQRFDPRTETFTTYNTTTPRAPFAVANTHIHFIREDHDGNFWVGGHDGLERVSADRQHVQNIALKQRSNVFDMLDAGNGLFWFATDDGLIRYEQKSGDQRAWTRHEGLASNVIISIERDDQGQLWMGTRRGISSLDPASGTIRNYVLEDGLQGWEFNRGSHLRSRNGWLYFGGTRGLNLFNPKDLPVNQHLPAAYIDGLELHGKTQRPGDGGPLKENVRYLKSLTLEHDEHDFTLHFTALDYTAPQRNRFRYRLDGFDSDWHEVGSDQRFAHYTNLPPGKYVFQVMAANNDGLWNTDGARLDLVIPPPWWESWQFRLACAAMLASLLCGGIWLRLRWERQRQTQLEQLAYHDSLTGLPNRYWLRARFDLIRRTRSAEHERHFALLFLDGDNFKAINDIMGHELGDRLLVQVARRLRDSLAPSMYITRHGGDEFIVLIEGIDSPDVGIRTAEHLLDQLKAPFEVDGQTFSFSASIGVVPSSAAYGNYEDMLADADIAMYRAKARGKNNYALYENALRIQSAEAVHMVNDLRQSLKTPDAGGLFLAYQPIVALGDGRLHGFEVLTRWNRPGYGPVPPCEFVTAAENSGLISELDHWVLQEACAQLARWHLQFPEHQDFSIAVNLSAKQLGKEHLAGQVMKTLRDHGLRQQRLKLEITETAIMEDLVRSRQLIEELNREGISFALDDFGTGFSSLGYLRQLPIQFVKIDRSFVHNIESDEKAVMIIKAIIALSHSLRMLTIAEGVETEAQRQLLESWNCDYGQGYLFAAALPPNEAEPWISGAAHG